MGRVPALDGLRGIAILSVLIWHFSNLLNPSNENISQIVVSAAHLCWSGVDLFFVLSGFLIGGILIDNRAAKNLWRVFYLRRALRIFPIYLIVLTSFLILVNSNAQLPWLLANSMPTWSYATFTQNFEMASQGDFGASYLGVTWSLAIEEQFYLILPFMVRFLSPKSLLRAVLGLIVGALLFRIAAVFWLGNFAGFVLMPGRSDSLFVGVLCAIVYRRPSPAIAPWRAITVGLFCAVLTVAGTNSFPISRTMLFLGMSLLALFYGAVLLSVLGDRKNTIHWIVDRLWFRKLGTIAYGVYLFHQPALGLMHGLVLHQAPKITSMPELCLSLVAYILAVVVAQLSWSFLERPLTMIGQSVPFESSRIFNYQTPDKRPTT